MSADAQRLKAVRMLLLANACWGLSFPVTKALALAQRQWLPESSTWFIAALCVTYRFGAAALVLLALCARSRPLLTRLEWEHGLGLGLFAGAGILLQIDGMAYTDASTSAFLTQCYCLWIPLWAAWRHRRPPTARVFASCVLVVAGVAALARVQWRSLSLGRGEWETIAASVVFTGQILWLDRPRYAASRVWQFSMVMFAVMALVCAPVAWRTAGRPEDWLRAYADPSALGLLSVLILFCTFGGYMIMNRWQRHLTATQAGLIYCFEPIFASLFALFLPALLAAWTGAAYANETLTENLLVGGSLITVANVLIQLPARPQPSPQAGSSGPAQVAGPDQLAG